MSDSSTELRDSVRTVEATTEPPGVFRLLVALYSFAVVVGTWLAIATGNDRSLAIVVILAAVFLAAEHRDRVFPDETGLSGSIAVALCAAVFLAHDGWPNGAFLCCAVGGLYLPHIRARAYARVIVNATSFGVSALVAAHVYAAIGPTSGEVMPTLGALLAATATYWLMNCLLLALATAAFGRGRVDRYFTELVRSDMVMLVFGFGGAVCGIVMTEVGTWVGLATLVALLVALDVFVISVPAGLGVLRSAWAIVLARGVSAGVAGTVGAVVTRAVAISVLGAVAGLAAGLAAGVAVVGLVVGLRLLVTRHGVDPALVGGVALVEIAFPLIGAASGVVTAVAGVSAGLVCASILVVGGSVAVAIRRRARERRPAIDDDTLLVAVAQALAEGLPSRTRER